MILGTATDSSHRLTWGPRAGTSVKALASSDEGRGHLRWIAHNAEAPSEDRQAARAALASTRPAPSSSAPRLMPLRKRLLPRR